jgi:tetratricopeptide (TPR) repeat protein
MIRLPIRLKCIVTALAVLVTFSGPLPAQQADLTDESALLAQLADAEPADAARLDRQLQALWDKSGSAAMDLLLKRAKDAIEVRQFDEALEHLTALTDHAPDFSQGWQMRAMTFFNMEMYGPALADLERAIALNPNNYNAIYGLGALLETFDEAELAFDAYMRVLAIHPHHEEVTKRLERLRTEVEGRSL